MASNANWGNHPTWVIIIQEFKSQWALYSMEDLMEEENGIRSSAASLFEMLSVKKAATLDYIIAATGLDENARTKVHEFYIKKNYGLVGVLKNVARQLEDYCNFCDLASFTGSPRNFRGYSVKPYIGRQISEDIISVFDSAIDYYLDRATDFFYEPLFIGTSNDVVIDRYYRKFLEVIKYRNTVAGIMKSYAFADRCENTVSKANIRVL